MTQNEEKINPIRKGLLELIVLKIIKKEKVYAADILTRLSQTDFAAQEGTLYPMLSRLSREQLLEFERVESEAGPLRKYYFFPEPHVYFQKGYGFIERVLAEIKNG